MPGTKYNFSSNKARKWESCLLRSLIYIYIYIWSLYKEKLVNLCFPSPFLVWAFIKFMATIILFLLSFALFAPFSSSTFQTLSKGSSFSSEKPEDVLTSPNVVFSTGFYSFGENAFCFAIERFNLSFLSCTNGVHTVMKKKLPTQREKGESNLGTREEENSDEKEMIFLTVHYSEVQYIYIYIYTKISYGLNRDPWIYGIDL